MSGAKKPIISVVLTAHEAIPGAHGGGRRWQERLAGVVITAGLSEELPGDLGLWLIIRGPGPWWITVSRGQGARAAPTAAAHSLCGRDLCSHVSGC